VTDFYVLRFKENKWEVARFNGNDYPTNKDSIEPSSYYPSPELAIARLMQLIHITDAVAPQSHPEVCEIGNIDFISLSSEGVSHSQKQFPLDNSRLKPMQPQPFIKKIISFFLSAFTSKQITVLVDVDGLLRKEKVFSPIKFSQLDEMFGQGNWKL
jgi:hypothetical protein